MVEDKNDLASAVSESQEAEVTNQVKLYSVCVDDWSSTDESIEEVATWALEEMSEEEAKSAEFVTVYSGFAVQRSFDDYFKAKKDSQYFVDLLGDKIRERAYEEAGECIGDYLHILPDGAVDDLGELISAWAAKHGIQPSWYVVEGVEEIKFPIPDDWER